MPSPGPFQPADGGDQQQPAASGPQGQPPDQGGQSTGMQTGPMQPSGAFGAPPGKGSFVQQVRAFAADAQQVEEVVVELQRHALEIRGTMPADKQETIAQVMAALVQSQNALAQARAFMVMSTEPAAAMKESRSARLRGAVLAEGDLVDARERFAARAAGKSGKKPVFGLMVQHRPYRCLDCGHTQSISTNHTDDVSDHCKNCSWKGIGFGQTGHNIPALGGHTYRRFTFAGGPKDIGPKNPHAKGVTEAATKFRAVPGTARFVTADSLRARTSAKRAKEFLGHETPKVDSWARKPLKEETIDEGDLVDASDRFATRARKVLKDRAAKRIELRMSGQRCTQCQDRPGFDGLGRKCKGCQGFGYVPKSLAEATWNRGRMNRLDASVRSRLRSEPHKIVDPKKNPAPTCSKCGPKGWVLGIEDHRYPDKTHWWCRNCQSAVSQPPERIGDVSKLSESTACPECGAADRVQHGRVMGHSDQWKMCPASYKQVSDLEQAAKQPRDLQLTYRGPVSPGKATKVGWRDWVHEDGYSDGHGAAANRHVAILGSPTDREYAIERVETSDGTSRYAISRIGADLRPQAPFYVTHNPKRDTWESSMGDDTGAELVKRWLDRGSPTRALPEYMAAPETRLGVQAFLPRATAGADQMMPVNEGGKFWKSTQFGRSIAGLGAYQRTLQEHGYARIYNKTSVPDWQLGYFTYEHPHGHSVQIHAGGGWSHQKRGAQMESGIDLASFQKSLASVPAEQVGDVSR